MKRRNFLIGAGVTATGAGLLAACTTARSTPDDVAERSYPAIGRIVETSLGAVHATDEGRGDTPPVILIHGASGNVRDWTFDITERLSAKRRVIAMDRPGFGYSERRGEDMWRPALQARQLREASKAMGVERPIIVGHSWGASVALAWALEAPEDVAGVVSVSGVTMPWGGITPMLDALGFGSLIANLYTRRITRTAEEGGVERFIQRAFRPQQPPRGYLDYVGAPLALRAKTLRANADDLAKTNPAIREVSEGYAELRTPVEIMHGDADWLLDIEQHGLAFADRLPNARLTSLPTVGHMAHHARIDQLMEIVDRFA